MKGLILSKPGIRRKEKVVGIMTFRHHLPRVKIKYKIINEFLSQSQLKIKLEEVYTQININKTNHSWQNNE